MRVATLLVTGFAAVHASIKPTEFINTIQYWRKDTWDTTAIIPTIPKDVNRGDAVYKSIFNLPERIAADADQLDRRGYGSPEFDEWDAGRFVSIFEEFVGEHTSYTKSLAAREKDWRGKKDIEKDIWASLAKDDSGINRFVRLLNDLLPTHEAEFEALVTKLEGALDAALNTWKAGDPDEEDDPEDDDEDDENNDGDIELRI